MSLLRRHWPVLLVIAIGVPAVLAFEYLMEWWKP